MQVTTKRRFGPMGKHVPGGFTLVEIAVVIVIVAMLLGALLAPLATQYSMRKNKEGERALSGIKEALLGFAVSNNGRLPCPDSDADGAIDGQEDHGGGGVPGVDDCLDTEGVLPWQTLGIFPTDPWGRLYRYQVTQPFAYLASTGQPPAAGRLDLSDVGTLTVQTRLEDKTAVDMTQTAVAVVWTTGANGNGGMRLGTVTTLAPPAVGTDEEINYSTTVSPTGYMLRVQTPIAGACDEAAAGQPYCEFDDLGTWISAPELFNRLVQAGLLP